MYLIMYYRIVNLKKGPPPPLDLYHYQFPLFKEGDPYVKQVL